MHVNNGTTQVPSRPPDPWSSPMDALTLKELYEAQLREELKRPPTPDVDRREISRMLRVSRGMTPGALRGHEEAGTWVWSDLHLGHTKTIEVFRRPFGTAEEMNDTIFRNWEEVVAPADTILILGDVTVHGLWGQRLTRVRQAPGRKILVYGNHEITSTGLVGTNGFRRSAQQPVRGRRPAPTADARTASSRADRLREHARPSTPPTRARENETHQRLRRTTAVPAKGALPHFAGSRSAS